jgi:hypothetical protein
MPISGGRSLTVPASEECVEQHLLLGIAGSGVLGMPLHGHGPRGGLDLHRLGHPVVGLCDETKPATETADRLVVHAVTGRRALGAQRGRQTAVAVDGDRVLHEPVVVRADVLHQVAAERDVEHLHAAADRQHRLVGLERQADDVELDLVVLGHDAVQLLSARLLPVPARVDVAAAVHDDRVDAVDQLGETVVQRRDRGQHERHAAGPFDRTEVALAGREALAAHPFRLGAETTDDEHVSWHVRHSAGRRRRAARRPAPVPCGRCAPC